MNLFHLYWRREKVRPAIGHPFFVHIQTVIVNFWNPFFRIVVGKEQTINFRESPSFIYYKTSLKIFLQKITVIRFNREEYYGDFKTRAI